MKDRFVVADVLASGIHDVRNCLFTAEAHLSGGAIDPERAREMILSAASRLERMLSAYHILRHDQHLAMIPTNVEDLLAEALLQARETSARVCEVSMQCEFFGEWGLARQEVQDVLVNAIQNAHRYAQSRIHLHARVDDGHLYFDVHDDGPGFQHAPTPGRPGEHGSGLGLFIAHHVARHHHRTVRDRDRHGSVELGASELLGGARFRLQLP